MPNNALRPKGLCPALYVYLALTILFILFELFLAHDGNRFSRINNRMIAVGLVFKLVWGIIIYYLCYTNHDNTAMFLVLFPMIFALLMLVFGIMMLFDFHHRHIVLRGREENI